MENDEKCLSLEARLAEAEERGYRRGLEEQVRAKLQEPGVWESPQQATEPAEQPGFRILADRRRSIWDLGGK